MIGDKAGKHKKMSAMSSEFVGTWEGGHSTWKPSFQVLDDATTFNFDVSKLSRAALTLW